MLNPTLHIYLRRLCLQRFFRMQVLDSYKIFRDIISLKTSIILYAKKNVYMEIFLYV